MESAYRILIHENGKYLLNFDKRKMKVHIEFTTNSCPGVFAYYSLLVIGPNLDHPLYILAGFS